MSAPSEPPKLPDRYRILSRLGVGGMGEVWRAYDTELKKEVAVKCLLSSPAANPRELEAQRERFVREAQAMHAVSSPHVVRVFQYEPARKDGVAYIVMEQVVGVTLEEHLKLGPSNFQEALRIVTQILDAAHAIHEQGITHRDLKPANVLLVQNHNGPSVKVADFGVAKMHEMPPLTRFQQPIGTLLYMSPEQLAGSDVDHRADLWAIGVIAHQCFGDGNPFAHAGDIDNLRRMVSDPKRWAQPMSVGLPPQLSPWFKKALAPKREDRFDTAMEMKQGLQELLRPGDHSPNDPDAPTKREFMYGLCFGFPSYRIAYLPAFPRKWSDPVIPVARTSLDLVTSSTTRRHPQAPEREPRAKNFENLRKACLNTFRLTGSSTRLQIEFVESSFKEYLLASEDLERDPSARSDLLTLEPDRTFAAGHPYICGVGLFVLTSDGRLVVSCHSERSHVYPGRLTFSASGSMPWAHGLDAFSEVVIKAHEELNHHINLARLELFDFGLDTRKGYVQLAFIERSPAQFRDVAIAFEEHPGRRQRHDPKESGSRRAIPSHLMSLNWNTWRDVCGAMRDGIKVKGSDGQEHVRVWEPAAEAGLLTLLVKEGRGSPAEIRSALLGATPWKRTQLEEWDLRAHRSTLSPDSSVRYSNPSEWEAAYAAAVVRFIAEDVRGKRVLEIGSGTGIISECLADKAKQLVCIEPIAAMIERHRERLASVRDKVFYVEALAQDADPPGPFDIVICSRVLIHQAGQPEFNALVAKIKTWAPVMFVFEDVTPDRTSGPPTTLRPGDELIRAFAGFTVEKASDVTVGPDTFTFLKLANIGLQQTQPQTRPKGP